MNCENREPVVVVHSDPCVRELFTDIIDNEFGLRVAGYGDTTTAREAIISQEGRNSLVITHYTIQSIQFLEELRGRYPGLQLAVMITATPEKLKPVIGGLGERHISVIPFPDDLEDCIEQIRSAVCQSRQQFGSSAL